MEKVPSFEKIEELFTDIVKMINILSYGLENSTTTYSHVEWNIQNDIFYMFKDLYKERPSNINTQKS